jgi:hypothetical protein
MIYSQAFHSLPESARQHVYRRLWEVLTLKDRSPEFESLTAKDRQAILEILRQTHDDLPPYWRAGM